MFIVSPRSNVVYGALHRDLFTPDSTVFCAKGYRLALQFDTIDPLSGGQIVDLDAPDLRPTMIE